MSSNMMENAAADTHDSEVFEPEAELKSSTSQSEANTISALSKALVLHLYHLQNSALNTLENHQRTKREMQTRESALSTNITRMIEDCQHCLSATGQVQLRLNDSTDASLKLISSDLRNARDKLTQRQ